MARSVALDEQHETSLTDVIYVEIIKMHGQRPNGIIKTASSFKLAVISLPLILVEPNVRHFRRIIMFVVNTL